MAALEWNHPLMRLVGWIKIKGHSACVWCGESFDYERKLTNTSPYYCSGTHAKAAKEARRRRKDVRMHELRHSNPLGGYEQDTVAARLGIPRLSMKGPMPVGLRCHYCADGLGTTRDHVVPVSMGGTNWWWNLVPACVSCNTDKAGEEGSCMCDYCIRTRKMHLHYAG